MYFAIYLHLFNECKLCFFYLFYIIRKGFIYYYMNNSYKREYFVPKKAAQKMNYIILDIIFKSVKRKE
jgi:hypothetical protein